MKLTIDNLDGRGAVDYSGCLVRGLKITRTLNAPSTMEAMVCLEGSGPVGAGLATPVRRGRAIVSSDAGTVLFTGYLTTEAVAEYAGAASEGAVYRLALQAVSDEWLLDKQAGLTRLGMGLETDGGTLVKSLLGRLGSGANGFGTAAVAHMRSVGVFEPDAAAAWSVNAGAAASAAYGAYRVLGGAVTLAPAGGTVHGLSDGEGSLNVSALRTGAVRELANDVTVSGAMEPAVYWNELFQGDGTTAIFDLTGQTEAVNKGNAVLIRDDFSLPAIDGTTWTVADPGSHLARGTGGLTMSGGNGLDGQTTLTALDPVEMGGTLVVELANVRLSGASAGVLGGVYQGSVQQANLFAGFNVRQSSGQTVMVPVVSGVEVGRVFPVLSGHSYRFRLRLNCPELLRVKQAYYAMSESGGGFAVNQFGGGLVAAPMSVVFEVSDLGLSSNTPVTVLYDGAVTSSPASATLVAVNSVQLFGSVGAVRVNRTGTGWVRSTNPATGAVSTRLVGVAGTGTDCTLTGTTVTGRVTFFPGREPGVGEVVSVAYRGTTRAVARLADELSVATEAAGGRVGTARWLGHVVKPPARCTEDCEAAAAAVLSFAASRSAAVAGSYTTVNPAGVDVWPGDVLRLTANGSSLNAIVRKVTVVDGGSVPETRMYQMAFANDWAEGLGLTLSDAIAADALIPAMATDASQSEAVRVLANLQHLTVVPATSANTALLVDAGMDAPAGGGFEVRSYDGGFGTADGGLVLRSPVRGFTIPVTATGETFYVRMYDGSTPPLYSRASSAIAIHLPVG